MAINIDDVYAGNSMNAAYVKESLRGSKVFRVANVSVQEFGDDDEPKKKKVVLHFDGENKGLALNVTNKNIIADAWGKDAEQWIGKMLRVYSSKTQFGGKMVDCVLTEPQGGADRDAPPPTASPATSMKASAWKQFKMNNTGDAATLAAGFKTAFGIVARGRAETELTEADWASVAMSKVSAHADMEDEQIPF